MKQLFRFYSLELLVIFAGLSVIVGAYLIFGCMLNVDKDQLAYVSIANTGLLFIIGHVYSRLKDRRDGRRKRAQDIFLEWHSKEIRESRTFASRWIQVHGNEKIPSLSELEKEAAQTYHRRYELSLVVARAGSNTVSETVPHAMDDPELKEFHFFKIYQFFERWALLIKNKDIDQQVASEYMSSYKAWYLNKFIKPWVVFESDEFIKTQLKEIVLLVTPDF